jgi:cytochrome c oxidase assembly protein Cox11
MQTRDADARNTQSIAAVPSPVQFDAKPAQRAALDLPPADQVDAGAPGELVHVVYEVSRMHPIGGAFGQAIPSYWPAGRGGATSRSSNALLQRARN